MHVATNIPSFLGVFRMIPDTWVIWGNTCVDFWDVPEVLAGKHSFCHVLAEFHYLFSDVVEESVAWPSSYKHDHEHWAFPQLHCHCCTQSNWVCANILLFDSKFYLSDSHYCISQGIDHVVLCYLVDDAIIGVRGDWGVWGCPGIFFDSFCYCCCFSDWAKNCIF